MSITWEQLQSVRREHRSMMNSAHMGECIEYVKAKYPDAHIVTIKGQLWGLASGEVQLSSPHSSHYECWIEARAIMEGEK